MRLTPGLAETKTVLTLWVLFSLRLSVTGGSPLIWTMALSSGSLCWISKTRFKRSSFSTTMMSALASRASLAISSALKMLDWPTAMPLDEGEHF